ncbi:MAG: helix-turn-helix transcriptional regulator [Acidobacteriota bacterium]
MSQRQQLERILEIDRQIRAGRYPNADKLAEKLEVGRRVIFNDRAFMMDRLGAPIALDRSRGGWFYTDPTWMLPSVYVTEGELLAFFLTVELAHRYLGTAFETPLRSAVAKISQGLKGPVSVNLQVLASHYTFDAPHAAPAREQTLLDLSRAIREHRLVTMTYYTAYRNAKGERTLEPYHLYNHEGDWYLVAYSPERRDFRYFHVGRMERVRVLDKGFAPRRGFDLGAFLAQAFQVSMGEKPVNVAIRFDARQAPYIRGRQWHASQKITEHKDGGLTLRMRTSGLGGVLRWVLQYGAHAEVLAPDALRKAVAAETGAMAKRYAEE